MRPVVVYQYLALWQNPFIDRTTRDEVKKQIVTSTGKTVTSTSDVASAGGVRSSKRALSSKVLPVDSATATAP